MPEKDENELKKLSPEQISELKKEADGHESPAAISDEAKAAIASSKKKKTPEEKADARSKRTGIIGGIIGGIAVTAIAVVCVRVIVGLSMSGSIVNPFSQATSYDYSYFVDKAIQAENVYSQDEDAYLVYAYGDDCAHCANIKQTVLSYAASGKTEVYFIENATKSIPKTETEEECRKDSLGATSKTQALYNAGDADQLHIAIYGTPTLYHFSTSADSEKYGLKYIDEVLIGETEITNALKEN
jgi:hypothetical protein